MDIQLTKPWRIRKLLMGIGAVLAMLGAVWVLQGLGALRGSPMTGDPFWAVTGGVTLIIGLLIAFCGWRISTGSAAA